MIAETTATPGSTRIFSGHEDISLAIACIELLDELMLRFENRLAPAAAGAPHSGLARGVRAGSSAQMKVSFTTKEYTRLLELVHLGLSVAGARADDPATMPERYADLAQKVFGLAEVFGCADLVERDVNNEFFPTEKLTEGIAQEKMDTFADELFWSELVSRLALRDLRAVIGAEAVEAEEMAPEHEDKLAEHEDAYWREFETHGVDHVHVLRGGRE